MHILPLKVESAAYSIEPKHPPPFVFVLPEHEWT
jgi:hypothetical protein